MESKSEYTVFGNISHLFWLTKMYKLLFILLINNDFPDDICDIVIYVNDTIYYSVIR